MSSETAPAKTPRLTVSLAVFCAALVAALLFTSAHQSPPEPQAAGQAPEHIGHPAHEQAPDHEAEHHGEATDAGPLYFDGGLWSGGARIQALAEIAIRSSQPGKAISIQSLAWNQGTLAVIDRSPLDQPAGQPALVVASIDHTGPDPSPEFAGAIQQHLAKLGANQQALIITPLPGPDERGEDEFPYDWTFLQSSEKIGLLDWEELLAEDQPNTPLALLTRWRDANAADDPAKLWDLGTASPYVAIPEIEQTPAMANTQNRIKQLGEFLLIYRALGVNADSLMDEAADFDSATLRATVARTIGSLADVTDDPIARLTILAEDKDMRVRYEALVSCLAIGGQRAAGVAQLVEAYEMDDTMRSFYAAAMQELLTYGEPVMADSRANRLRRMPLNELLAEERDALVCSILLQRTDLPDGQIDEVLGQLASANGSGPLVSLLNLLETMNPSTLNQREVLLKTLVGWKANELKAQAPRLIEMATTGKSKALQAAAAGALINAESAQGVIASLGHKPVTFKGLAFVTDASKLKAWIKPVTDAALGLSTKVPEVSIAALDAIRFLPASGIPAQDLLKVLSVAKQAESIDLRFAAIRAINALPDTVKPEGSGDLTLTTLTIAAVPGQMKYDLTTLTVPAGRPVELTLVNPDTMEHNLAITKPGTAQLIGLQITAMNPSDAAKIGYIPPDSTDVLHHTRMVPAGSSDTLRFIAPDSAGTYDYVCTFPGHYTSMIGVLQVVAP